VKQIEAETSETGDLRIPLQTEHRHLDEQVKKLQLLRSLSPLEQLEYQMLKKRKLAVKERLAKLG
jgi:hypothetical protein